MDLPETQLLLIFVTLTGFGVALAGWAVARAVGGAVDPGRRRLRQRLTSGGSDPEDAAEQSRLLLQGQRAGALEDLLGRFGFFQMLGTTLRQAAPDMTVGRFLAIAASISLGCALLVAMLTGSLIVAGIAALIGGYAPFLYLANRRMRRQRQLIEQLPDALDFLGRSLRGGHSLPVGLQIMASDLPQPLAAEFQRAYGEMSLGVAPEESLGSMTRRIDSQDFAFFVTAVLVQRQTGGDLAQVLDNITGMIRQRIQLQQRVKAKTAEGRMTGYLLVAFPMVMFVATYILSPETTGVLINTTAGRVLLGVALGLSMLGLLVIRKITTLNV